MFILRCDQNRNLEFVKKDRIIQGEHCFDSIKVELPETISGYSLTDLAIKMKFVSGSGYINRQVTINDGAVYTDIDYTLTETAKRWLFYLTFYYNDGEDIEVGKTNSIAIQINKIPYSEELEVKYKEPEIVMMKGDKGDPGPMGPIGPQGPPGVTSYADLTDKPSVNGATLSGNKTTSELGLQKKLTAGTNITLESDGTISASGGVTSYNDLTDKPKVWGDTGQYDLDKILYFPDFDLSLNGWVRQLSIKPLNYSKLENGTSYYMHENFKNNVNLNVPTLDLYGKWFCFDANNAVGLPSGIDVVTSRYENQNKKVVWGSYRNCQVSAAFIEIELPLIEEIYWTDSNLKNHHAVRTYFKDTTNIKKFTDWTELSGGSQIVSGAVNQNGSITFTDSDGNTFTTSGSSVIGADGFSPVATVTQTASGATVTITDKNGTTTANISNGAPGQDYVLTAQDKSDIANIVLNELPTTQGVLYGNTSN